MKTITIQNVGPIARLEIPIPEAGGVVVLRGRNGGGKTKATEAVAALLGGEGAVEARDGAVGSAFVDGLGVRLSVGKRTRASGELEVSALEGRDPSRLVDPGIDDPARADARRIDELCLMAGVKAEIAPFQVAFGVPEADALPALSEKAQRLLGGSLPEFAAQYRRDLQEAARAHESAGRALQDRAGGLLAGAGEEDARSGGHPPAFWHEAAGAASARASEARRQRKAREAELAAQGSATKQIAELEAGQAVDIDGLERERLEALRLAREGLERAVALEREMLATRATASNEEQRAASLGNRIRAEEVRQKALAELRAKVVASVGPGLEAIDAEIGSADQEAAAARGALEAATLNAKRAESLRVAEMDRMSAAAKLNSAACLRDMASACERVLSEAIGRVAPRGLRVVEGRLILDTPRGETLFADLSHGERWRIALDVAIDSVGEGGLITIEQEAWEGLDPANRMAVLEHVKGRRTVILTAEAADGNVRAEVLD